MLPLDHTPPPAIRQLVENPPFSFHYDDRDSRSLLPEWSKEQRAGKRDGQHTTRATVWRDSVTGLQVTCSSTCYDDYPAVEWILSFENTGSADTPIIENIQVLDWTLRAPREGTAPYRLHRVNGAPANPTDFEPAEATVDPSHPQLLSAGGGRSSNRDFPFFTVETGAGAYVIAIGWSGQWAAGVTCTDDRELHVTAGQERTRFRLHPGESVRTPRVLILHGDESAEACHAAFRQLVYRHYAARRGGEHPVPVLFCNTCATRGGGWLNECNAENQISLIRAYAPLGLEALITDAGWFEGGWPAGAGNWTPRKDAYPQGMRPVAEAARDRGLIYGLWFEPERVMAGSALHREHPEWLLAAGDGPQETYLANFGLQAVQDHFFNMVRGFMELPGFRVYRQDFNLDPLPYWRHADAPDREGITEIRYVEGLYAFWDRIASAWPDSLREECASGGRRIDLETVMRMHIHQKSDYWFDNEVDQASLWALSQYLPNSVISVAVARMDDYSFHSVLPASVCLGWIADAPDFDRARATRLVERYRGVRHLLVGAWYPLTPWSRDTSRWLASQYHRPDLDEGLILAFRRANCADERLTIRCRAVDADATYHLRCESTGQQREVTGRILREGFDLTLPAGPASELIVYRRVR